MALVVVPAPVLVVVVGGAAGEVTGGRGALVTVLPDIEISAQDLDVKIHLFTWCWCFFNSAVMP